MDDNYDIFENGNIKVGRTKDKTNTYTYHRNDGSTVDLGTYDVVNNAGKDMVKIPSLGTSFSKALSNKEDYLPEDAVADFLGATYNFYSDNDYKSKINQFMSKDYKHSGSIVSKPCIDIEYVGTEGTSWETQPVTTSNNVDVNKSLKLAKEFIKYGWGDKTKWSILTEDALGKSLFSDYTTVSGHQNHMHIQGFDKDKVEIINK